jgi:hypothetical protein
VRVALGLALLVLLAGALLVVSADRPRLAGTNNVFDTFPNVPLDAGSEACARDEIVPGGTAAVRVRLTAEQSRGPLEVRLEQAGRSLASGVLPSGWGDGRVDVSVRPVVPRSEEDVSVCIVNRGDGRVNVWGYGAASDGPRVVVDGSETNERMRLTYLRAGEESGWDVATAVVRRMGNGRGSLLDGWAFYGWLFALGGALAAAVAALLKGRRA